MAEARKKETFEVARKFHFSDCWIEPAAKGAEPITVEMSEAEARFYLLNGTLKRPGKAVEEGQKAPAPGEAEKADGARKSGGKK